ncbi:zinc finger MYM-type protein 1-like [Parasteatoda tepidariorum]|uniref:zinc finger MYM-type protein 1-like n=1 Tax=Parasteatoda tepidariorum TaxID=114398 RepID=UPI0039BC4F7A
MLLPFKFKAFLIQNEFIHLLASTVRNQLINDIKRNKYYGLLFDSTPDISHREQMSQVARYVDADFINKKVSIKESFLSFIEIHAKDAASIENTILEKLNYDEISLTNCRSQCYDNAAVMAGHTSETRWSARIQAVIVIIYGLENIKELIEKLAEHTTTTSDNRSEATILLQNILTFSFITLVHFWYEILRRIDRVQLRLQDPRMNFREVFHDLESLATELAEI